MGLTMPTLQEKYDFLLRHLKVVHVDLWENDALLELDSQLYFQFSDKPDLENIDDHVANAVICEQERLEFEKKFAEAKLAGPVKVKKGTVLLRSKK